MNSAVILIVDDDPDAIALLQYAFAIEAPGLTIDYVNNGKAAIDYLQEKQFHCPRAPLPDLVLLDLKMPVMDGFDFLECLKHSPELRPLAVVVFSSSAEPVDKQRAWELGADGYLVKSPGLSPLLEQARVLAFYARHRVWAAAAGGVGLELRLASRFTG